MLSFELGRAVVGPAEERHERYRALIVIFMSEVSYLNMKSDVITAHHMGNRVETHMCAISVM